MTLDEQRREALHRALHCVCGAAQRWEQRRVGGLTDAELALSIGKEFGEWTSGSEHGGWTVKGLIPGIWFGGCVLRGRKPDLQGKALVVVVREFLGVPLPLKHEGSVCEISQVAVSEARAPWAGLPLMQMMEARG